MFCLVWGWQTQVPVGRPSEELLVGAANRGVVNEVVSGNVAALGGIIGCNDGDFEDFLLDGGA